MERLSFRCLLAAGPLLLGICLLAEAQNPPSQKDPKPAAVPDLKEYRTVANAITAKITATGQDGTGKTGFLGVSVVGEAVGQVVVEEVHPDSPAARSGLLKGDIITHVGDHAVTTPQAFGEWLQAHSAGEALVFTVLRRQETVELTITLATASRPLSAKDGGGKGGKGGGKGGKGGQGALTLFKQPVLRAGVVCIEFSDIKHNSKVSSEDWHEALFSTGIHTNKKNATGQTVHGSLNDWFLEQSGGGFHLEGKVFDWVAVGKKRADYTAGTATNKTAVLSDALKLVTARDGKDALKGLDGLIFLYAGDRAGQNNNKGAIYYPHAGGVNTGDQVMRYLLTAEGSTKMTGVNGFAKIAGEMLGLPDLAARTENVGSRGLGVWSILSNPISDGRPQHFCAWAKEKLGWTKPAIIDPTVKQKLLLAPIEDSAKECFKVLVRPNGSEYYLLENRRKKGFDTDLPAEGLLIWRVVNDRPVLVESHGIDNPKAPETQLSAIPYPSPANKSFTPDTTPSSRSPHGGGLPVHISQIQRLPDGRIAFVIGYEYR